MTLGHRGRYNFGSSQYYPEVDTFADLPNVAGYAGHVYLVLTNSWSGIWYRRAGLYHSDGTDWTRLANLTVVSDEIFTLVDDATNTKKAMFECSSIAAATTRTFTFPDASGTLALQSWVSGLYVPYTGATTSVDLGAQTFTTTGHVGIGVASDVYRTLHVAETYTATGRYGIQSEMTFTPASIAASAAMHGGLSIAHWASDLDGESTAVNVYGHEGSAYTDEVAGADGDINTAVGLWGRVKHRSTATVTNAIGVLGDVFNDDTGGTQEDGDITTASSFLASASTNKGTGTIATRYGLYIEDVTGGGSLTNQYGIYCPALAGAGTDNLFIKNVSADSDFGSGDLTTTGWGRFDGGIGIDVAANASYGVNIAMDGATIGLNYVNSALGILQEGIGVSNVITASGASSSGVGVYSLVRARGDGAIGYGIRSAVSTSDDANAQIIYGSKSFIETRSGGSHIGYGFGYEIDCDSSGGDQYAFYADADYAATVDNFYGLYVKGNTLTANTAKWGVYIVDLDNYFGGAIAIVGSLSTALTGTVEANLGSNAIVGTGTNFDNGEIAVGDAIKIESDEAAGYEIFTVATITDDTHLTVDSNYAGSNDSGLDAWSDPDLFTIANGDSTNLLTCDKSGDFDFHSGDLVTLGTLGAGATTLDSLVVDSPTLVVNATSYEDKVGIGTASPGETLEVAGNIAVTGIAGDDVYIFNNAGSGIRIRSDSLTTQWWAGDDGPAYFGTVSNDDLHIQTNNNTRITILSGAGSGYVGIGVTDPDAKLEVAGTLHVSDAVTFDGTLGAGAITGTSIADSELTTGRIICASVDGLLTDWSAFTFDGNNLTCTGYGRFNEIRINVNNSYRMYRGDASSIYLIPASAGANFVRVIPNGANRTIWQIFNTDYVADSTNYEYTILGWDSTRAYFEIRSANGGTGTLRPIKIWIAGNTDQLHLATDGKVGIGKVPTVELDVAGDAKISGTLEVGSTIQTYTPTNVTTDRSFDADTVAVAELADVVGTLIADLQTIGLVN